MSNQLTRLLMLGVASIFVLLIAAGCHMVEPEPTPSPAEAVQEFVSAYPLAATAWELQFFGEPAKVCPCCRIRAQPSSISGTATPGLTGVAGSWASTGPIQRACCV